MIDNEKQLTCPACGKIMTKFFLKNTNFHIDICENGCGGIYFDNFEFNSFDEPNESIDEILEILEKCNFKKELNTSDKKEGTRICPSCGHNMAKHFISPKLSIKIDDCYTCGAKFFDVNELEEMKSEYSSDAEYQEENEKLCVDALSNAGYDFNYSKNRARDSLGYSIFSAILQTFIK